MPAGAATDGMLGMAGPACLDINSLRDKLLAILTMINWERGQTDKVRRWSQRLNRSEWMDHR
jgi:hypothetical protein